MDYKGQAELLLKDAAEFAEYDVPGYIIGDLRQGSKFITDLLARAEAAEARAEKAEAERDRVISALQNLRDSVSTAILEYEQKQKEKYGEKEG